METEVARGSDDSSVDAAVLELYAGDVDQQEVRREGSAQMWVPLHGARMVAGQHGRGRRTGAVWVLAGIGEL